MRPWLLLASALWLVPQEPAAGPAEQWGALTRRMLEQHAAGELVPAIETAREALAVIDALLQEDPRKATARHNLGLLLVEQKKLDEASRFLQEAGLMRRRLLGDDHLKVAESLLATARLAEAQGRLDNAYEDAAKALAIRESKRGPADALSLAALDYLIVIAVTADRDADARKLLLHAISLDDGQGANARLVGHSRQLAALDVAAGDLAAAASRLAGLVGGGIEEVQLAIDLARIEVQQDDTEAALARLIALHEIDPAPPLTGEMAALLISAGRFDEVLDLVPEGAEAAEAVLRARALAGLDRRDEAVGLLDTIIDNDASAGPRREALALRGGLALERGDLAAATADLARALELAEATAQGANAELLELLELAAAAEGDQEKADGFRSRREALAEVRDNEK